MSELERRAYRARQRSIDLVVASEVEPRQDEEIAWHRRYFIACLIVIGISLWGLVCAVWFILAVLAGASVLAPVAATVTAGAATQLGIAGCRRERRRHHCFDAHAYLAMRLAAMDAEPR